MTEGSGNRKVNVKIPTWMNDESGSDIILDPGKYYIL